MRKHALTRFRNTAALTTRLLLSGQLVTKTSVQTNRANLQLLLKPLPHPRFLLLPLSHPLDRPPSSKMVPKQSHRKAKSARAEAMRKRRRKTRQSGSERRRRKRRGGSPRKLQRRRPKQRPTTQIASNVSEVRCCLSCKRASALLSKESWSFGAARSSR